MNREPDTGQGLSGEGVAAPNAYWRAVNYLAAGQIYLMANPLLREPLRAEHVKPRLLGHWGTRPGLNLVCVHLKRLRRNSDLTAGQLGSAATFIRSSVWW